MRFEVLGPLRALAPVGAGIGVPAGRERLLGGPKQRLVLALLLAEPNTTVSVERLIDGVWGEAPPGSARHTLQSYVSELRKTVGDVIERDGLGYAIRVDRDALDALEFEARVSAARARVGHDPGAEVAELEAALALWRGQAFEGFADQAALQIHATRLDEIRLAAIEAAFNARLTLGEHAAVVVELDRLTREYPYREELRALQMLALYRSGRQAEALRAFQSTRSVLGDELGIDPSPRLRRLEEQILLQDPDLDLKPNEDATRPVRDGHIENPYVGLRAFQESDALRFFGQDRLVSQLTDRVASAACFTAVVGPSGSGKSSAVQAGLVPRLRWDAPELLIATMQPGSQPFAELEAALARLNRRTDDVLLAQLRTTDAGFLDAAIALLDSSAARLLLVVDQFEELFTLADPDEAERFVTALVVATEDPRQRMHVLVTMRADFYARPLADLRLGPLFAANVVNVVPLGPDELEAAATLPALQADVALDARLLRRLIADVAGQPNALPLFQYALTELFDERVGFVLDLATYERIGGVRKAVARRAESVYTHLDGDEQEAVRQLFLRIATVSGEAVGRRRVPASELAALDVDIVALQTAINAFSRYRLLALDRDPATGAPTVEVAHEALLAEWHRLRDWIDESRGDLANHARFVIALHEWMATGRDAGYLLSGSRLDDYKMWATSTRLKLTEPERVFLEASIAARDAAKAEDIARESRARRLRRRSRRQLVTLFVAMAVLAGVIAYPIVTANDPRGQIAVALAAPRGQQTFEQLIARGVEDAAERHGLDAVVVEPPFSNVQQTFGELAADADLVFGSFLIADSMLAVAANNPDSTLVFVDVISLVEIPNGVFVRFAHEEGSYLVGAAAALESGTSRIGYVGANSGPFIEEFRAGFEQGARAARPDIEVVSALIAPDDVGALGYSDAGAARAIAERMYRDDRVDVIFVAAGSSARGVVDAATDLSEELGRHLWVIGADTETVFELPTEQRRHLLTSMVKNLEVGIERVVADHEAGTLAVPATLRLGVADGAVGYSVAGGHMRPSTIAAVDSYAGAIAQGAVVVDATPTGSLIAAPSG